MARYHDVAHLPNSEQVAQRLETIAADHPPGHRVFLRELADRLRKIGQGDLHKDWLFLDGWLMGQHPGNESDAD
jgi:hypothetical protein